MEEFFIESNLQVSYLLDSISNPNSCDTLLDVHLKCKTCISRVVELLVIDSVNTNLYITSIYLDQFETTHQSCTTGTSITALYNENDYHRISINILYLK